MKTLKGPLFSITLIQAGLLKNFLEKENDFFIIWDHLNRDKFFLKLIIVNHENQSLLSINFYKVTVNKHKFPSIAYSKDWDNHLNDQYEKLWKK